MQLALILEKLSEACEKRNMNVVKIYLLQAARIDRIYKNNSVVSMMIKYALDTELMQVFFGVGLRADSNDGVNSPFFVAIQYGTVKDVMFYIKNRANVNLILLEWCPMYHALRTKIDPIPKIRELLLARSVTSTLPYRIIVPHLFFGLDKSDHALHWLRWNQNASELQLLVQGASLDRLLRYIHFAHVLSVGGSFRSLRVDVLTALPRATKEAIKVLHDTLLPWSPATRYTFNSSFCQFADALLAMKFLPVVLTDVVISFLDLFER